MEKLFTSNKFFLTAVILATAGFLYTVVKCLCPSYLNIQTAVCTLALAVCEIVLYTSYQKHDKNVMKGIMGGLLIGLFMISTRYIDASDVMDRMFGIPYAIIVALLVINHFIINSDRHPKPIVIEMNQVIVWLCFFVIVLWNLVSVITRCSPIVIADAFFNIVSMFGLAASVVCIESRLDAYRLDREAAGWTAEKGYPKEYDRTKNYGTGKKKK